LYNIACKRSVLAKWIVISVTVGLVGLFVDGWNVAALLFTAVIIIWYSVETSEIRRLSFNPGLTVRWLRPAGGEWVLILTNQGKGSAINPHIEVESGLFRVETNGVNAIYPGDTIELSVKGVIGQSPMNATVFFKNDKPEILTITFEMGGKVGPSFVTKIAVGSPPISRVISTNWGIDSH
jgi:hypothetical protein